MKVTFIISMEKILQKNPFIFRRIDAAPGDEAKRA